MIAYCQLDMKEQFSVEFQSKYNNFHTQKCISNCHLQKCQSYCISHKVLSAGFIVNSKTNQFMVVPTDQPFWNPFIWKPQTVMPFNNACIKLQLCVLIYGPANQGVFSIYWPLFLSFLHMFKWPGEFWLPSSAKSHHLLHWIPAVDKSWTDLQQYCVLD